MAGTSARMPCLGPIRAIRGCGPVGYVIKTSKFLPISLGTFPALTPKEVMGKLLGLLLGGLAIGVIVGVVFQMAYPNAQISPDLGLLFALVGLVLSWLVRAAWHTLRGRQQ